MQRTWMWLLLSLAFGIVSGPAKAGLVGYWDFDEDAGFTAVDTGSGGNNGTLTPSTAAGPSWIGGVSGAALHFDDSGDYVSTAYAGVGGSDPRSVAFWVRTTDPGVTGLVAYGDDHQNGQKWHLRINTAAGNGLVGGIRTEVGGGYKVGDVNIADGQWHHVASVFDGADVSDVVHYVDGALIGASGTDTQAINTDIASGNAEPVTIARRTQGNSNETLGGSMDEVRIYDHALSAPEVAALAAYAPPSQGTGLVAHWDFEDNTGYTATDQAAGNDGTLTASDENGPRWTAGYTGQALYYDGNNDSVVATDFKGVVGKEPRTLSAWIKLQDDGESDDEIMSWGNNQAGQKWIFRIQDDNGPIDGNLRVEVNGGYVVGTADLRDDQWHHVAAVLPDSPNPNVNDVLFYVDGAIDPISASLGRAINTAVGEDVRIGVGHGGYEFSGKIDEARIYNTALTAGEIATLAALAPTPSPTGLVAHWNFNDGPGSTTAADVAGLNTATLLPSAAPPEWSAWRAPTGEPYNAGSLDFSTANGYLEASQYKGVTGQDERTVSAWIKTDLATDQNILSWGENLAGQKWVFRLQDGAGGSEPHEDYSKGVIRVEVNGGYIVGTTFVADNEWHHVAAVLPNDGSPNVNEVVLYVDGMREAKPNTGNTNTDHILGQAINTASNADVRIGNDFNGNRRFDGRMDDVRIHDTALTAGDIRALAWAQRSTQSRYVKAVIADDPIAYWRMGEPANSTAINQGSLGPVADGTYTGGFSRPVPSLLTMDSDGATAFDGVNGKVNIPDVNGINTGGPFVNKSVELWFQTSDDITARQVLYEQGGVTRGMSLYIEDSQVFVGAWNTANDDGGNLSTPWAGPIFYGTDIEANAKYMLNLVMTGDDDGLAGTLNGFLNGLPFDLGQPDGLTGVGRMFAAASDIAIGSHRNEVRFQSGTVGGTGAGSWFAGVIDEVSLYNTPLTADQIAFHYYEGSIPEPGSLALLGLGLAAIARRRRRAR